MNIPENDINFTKWITISLVIHLLAVSSITYFSRSHNIKRDYYAPVYKVNLVTIEKPKRVKKKRVKATKVKKVATIKKAKKTKVVSKKKAKVVKEVTEDPSLAIAALRNKHETEMEIEKLKAKIERESSTEPEEDVVEDTTQPTGASAGASKAGVKKVSIEDMDRALQEYYDLLWEKIEREWVLPGTGNFKGMTTIVTVTIQASGKLIDVSIEENSGNGFFDQSALRAVRKAQPFPPLPQGYRGGMEIGIRFKQ